jgi:hypothetical protein
MNIDKDTSLQIINTQYAVFFGVIFSLSFYVSSGSPPSLHLSIAPSKIPMIAILAIYYISDWFTANVVRHRIDIPSWELFIQVLSVVFLGMVIVSMNTDGVLRFILLGGYALVVALYDALLQWRINQRIKRTTGEENAGFGMILAGIRFVLALLILVPASISLFRPDVEAIFLNAALWLVISIVTLKFVRLIYMADKN